MGQEGKGGKRTRKRFFFLDIFALCSVYICVCMCVWIVCHKVKRIKNKRAEIKMDSKEEKKKPQMKSQRLN